MKHNTIELSSKSDWSSVYSQPTPSGYLLHARQNEYQVPDFACQHLRPLIKAQAERFQRPINVLDLGASYGILSSLLLFNLTFDELTDFFVEKEHSKTLDWDEIEDFFSRQTHTRDQLKFYLTDISQPAMDFATRLNLCERAFCLDMKQGELTDELRETIGFIDLYIAVGSLAYIGDAFFAEILPIITQGQCRPLFAFTVYRSFYPKTLAQLFSQYGYRLQRIGTPLKRGRRFASDDEQAWAINQLCQQQINPAGFEDEGYYACEFLLAAPEDNNQGVERV